jgi:hypothetical protein
MLEKQQKKKKEKKVHAVFYQVGFIPFLFLKIWARPLSTSECVRH